MAVDAPQEAVEALRGVVSAMPGGGETRSGQDEMCEAVASALDQDRHLVVAAGTGTGKSMAYLAPLVSGGRRAVVATATKALQDQLVDKDLPLLARALGVPLKYAVLAPRILDGRGPCSGRSPRWRSPPGGALWRCSPATRR